MPPDISLGDIQRLLETAGIGGFTGNITPLGGGEGNDTFALDCGEKKVVLRIARYDDTENLEREANALSSLDMDQVPKLLYFDRFQRIKDRAWIAESFIRGTHVKELSTRQYENLGRLLAQIHSIRQDTSVQLDLWKELLGTSRRFGNEQAFLNHTDSRLSRLVRKSYDYFKSHSFHPITPTLTHGDVSLSNILVSGDSVSLIDWEFSRFTDPMADFAAMFYEDMAYNNGKWRIHITPEDKKALFLGYSQAGGSIDGERLRAWSISDKLGRSLYLYWKLHEANHAITTKQALQYREDLEKLTKSLERSL